MNQELLKNNFVVINDFISKDRANNLYHQFKEIYKTHQNHFNDSIIAENSKGLYRPLIFMEILIEKIPFIADFLEEPVFPTYAYGRFYKKNNSLLKHIDRPCCEISVTLNLNGDKEWPIWFTKPDDSAASVILKPGQAAIYLGRNSLHWRDKYEGEEYTQVFLHYVKAKGENRWAIFDIDKKQEQNYGY